MTHSIRAPGASYVVGVVVLTLAALAGLDLPLHGQGAENPTDFQATSDYFYDINGDLQTSLTAGVRKRYCTTYRGRRRCYTSFESRGRVDLNMTVTRQLRNVFDVSALDLTATSDYSGGYGEAASDSLAEGTTKRGKLKFKRKTRSYRYNGRRYTITTDETTLKFGAKLEDRTKLKLNGVASSYGGADYFTLNEKKSKLSGGIVPDTFERDVRTYNPRTGTYRTVTERPKKLSLSGALPVQGAQTVAFTATWTSDTRGQVVFSSPGFLRDASGTIRKKGNGDFVVKGPKGSNVTITVDPDDGSGSANLGYGKIPLDDGTFVLDPR